MVAKFKHHFSLQSHASFITGVQTYTAPESIFSCQEKRSKVYSDNKKELTILCLLCLSAKQGLTMKAQWQLVELLGTLKSSFLVEISESKESTPHFHPPQQEYMTSLTICLENSDDFKFFNNCINRSYGSHVAITKNKQVIRKTSIL